MQIDSVSQAYRGICRERIKQISKTVLFLTLCKVEKRDKNEGVQGGDSVLSSIKSAALGALGRDLDSTVRVTVIDDGFSSDGDGTGISRY